jgi:hypothetical protein
MEDVRPFTFTTLASLKDGEVDEYESDNDSYDDRSNNGQFEFPLESRQKAELKRSYGASQDICKSTCTRSTRDSTRTTLTSYTSAGRDSMLGDALEPNNNSSDLLVEWPDVTRRRVTFPSVHADEKPFERESDYPRTQFSKQTSHRKCCDIGSNTITTNQWTNLKYNTSLAKAREKQLKRASISSIYDLQLKPISISTSSVTSASTCPTVMNSPLRWAQTIISLLAILLTCWPNSLNHTTVLLLRSWWIGVNTIQLYQMINCKTVRHWKAVD